jgi:hypothetical protein
MRKLERLPVEPATIEVLGHRVKPTDPAWTGLDWSRAELRHTAKIAVPWCHPSDQTGSPDDFDCIYAIYPRAEIGRRWKNKVVKNRWFERDGDKWFVVHEYEPLPAARDMEASNG